MTQTPNNFKWRIQFPANEVITGVGRPCLTAACYGNDRIATLLNYFMYDGSNEIEDQHLGQDCKVVTFTRKHEDMLERLNYNVSEKTLISYISKLNTWGYVTSQPYRRGYTVNFEAIQKAINNPPKREPKPVYDRHPKKGCKTTTLQPSEPNDVKLQEKVEELQQKVYELQLNVVTLQEKVEVLLTLQPATSTSSQAVSQVQNESLENREITRDSKIDTTKSADASKTVVKHKDSSRKHPAPKQKSLIEDDKTVYLTSEENRIYEYWCVLHDGFRATISTTAKQRCGQLAPVIKTQEQMDSLYAFALKKAKALGRGVHLGDLSNAYTEWRSANKEPIQFPTLPDQQQVPQLPRSDFLVSEEQGLKNKIRNATKAQVLMRERGKSEDEIAQMHASQVRLEAELEALRQRNGAMSVAM